MLDLLNNNFNSSGLMSIQIIPNRLYWVSSVSPPKNINKSFYFNIDNDLQYEPFNKDFGPLNLGKTWKYITELEKLMSNKDYEHNKIYHYTSTDPAKSVNSAYLICAFQIAVLGYSAEKAYSPFEKVKLVSFRDASYGECTYKCTLLDCLKGLDYAIKLGWFNYKKFNLKEYEHYQQVENGDLNWIIPSKFVAFSSPYDAKYDKYGNRTFTPQDYVPIFEKLGVTTVIRLNNQTYKAEGFTKNKIKHEELFFTDGTAPNSEIVDAFLNIVENQPGAIAVHCKAGLGRTGCLIACYAMKHYHFAAADFIGWIRIARPGSILGPQQHFLIKMEQKMREKGKNSPIWKSISSLIDEKDIVDKMHDFTMNDKQMNIMKKGDFGQGQNLVQAKMRKQQQKQKFDSPKDSDSEKKAKFRY